jgi:hypothetical protein
MLIFNFGCNHSKDRIVKILYDSPTFVSPFFSPLFKFFSGVLEELFVAFFFMLSFFVDIRGGAFACYNAKYTVTVSVQK